MHPLLESAWLKVQRANKHLETFKTFEDAYSQSQLHKVWFYIERDTGDEVFQLKGALDKPSSQIGPVIGEVLFNFRSALDHLMWQLVVCSGGTPTKRTEFPICETADVWNDRRRGGRMIGDLNRQTEVGKRTLEVLEKEQPYNRPDYLGSRLLLLLDTLHNIDKHRHFNVVVGGYSGVFIGAMREAMDSAQFLVNFTWYGRVKENAVLGRVPRAYAHVNFRPSFHISFGEGSEAEWDLVRHSYLAHLLPPLSRHPERPRYPVSGSDCDATLLRCLLREHTGAQEVPTLFVAFPAFPLASAVLLVSILWHSHRHAHLVPPSRHGPLQAELLLRTIETGAHGATQVAVAIRHNRATTSRT